MMMYVQQVPFDRLTPLNCNNQGDVKKWLSAHVSGSASADVGANFQLPDKREHGPIVIGELELRRQ